MLSKKYWILVCCFFISNICAEILNISENESISNQPKFTEHNGAMFSFWVDGQNEAQNIFYRSNNSGQWSATDTINCSGDVALYSVVSADDKLYLMWVESTANLNHLMIGYFDISSNFISNEIIFYDNFIIMSASILIDELQKIHITWDIYNNSDVVRLLYSSAYDIMNLGNPEILYENNSIDWLLCPLSPQLVKNPDNDIVCFWNPYYFDSLAINYRKKNHINVWESAQEIMAWGSYFTVKNDSQNNIHLVVNEEFMLCPCNNIFYISLIGSEWSDFVLIPFGKDDYYDNDERWNPQINFIEDDLLYISWDHHYSDDYTEVENWIGSTIKSPNGWHIQPPFAENRNPQNPIPIIENSQVHYIWYDQTDGDDDIYYSIIDLPEFQIPSKVENLNITMDGNNCILDWSPVTETIYGISIQNLIGYIIYHSETTNDEDFIFLSFTTQTNFTHEFVVQYSPQMFYNVTAVKDFNRKQIEYLEGLNSSREKIKWSFVKQNLEKRK